MQFNTICNSSILLYVLSSPDNFHELVYTLLKTMSIFQSKIKTNLISSKSYASQCDQLLHHWSRLPREVVGSPSPEVFKKRVDFELVAQFSGALVNTR